MSIDVNKANEVITPTCKNGYLTNLAPAMSIWHDGSPMEDGTAVTAATIEVESDGDLVGTVNGSADTRIGAGGVYTDAGHTGLTAYKHFNAIQGWNLRLEGLRGANSISGGLGTLAAASCFRRAVQPLIKTAGIDIHGLVISNRQMNFGGRLLGASKLRSIEDECGAVNKLYYLWITATDAGAGRIKIYSVTGAEAADEELIYDNLSSASTAQTELNFQTHPLCAKPNRRLLIQYVAGGAMTATSECFVNGKSVIL